YRDPRGDRSGSLCVWLRQTLQRGDRPPFPKSPRVGRARRLNPAFAPRSVHCSLEGLVMTDVEFLDAFESGALSTAQFHHRDHLRLAWLQVDRLGLEGAAAAVSAGIRGFAAEHGLDRLYHETL